MNNSLTLTSCYSNSTGFLYTALKSSNFSNIGAANNLAEALRINDDNELAIRVLENTIQQTKHIDQTGLLEYSLGRLYELTDEYQKAKEFYLTASILQPKNILYWERATTLKFSNSSFVNYQEAENVLAQALSENPLHPELLSLLGWYIVLSCC